MRTIAVVNQKGGCGKTTTVANLAGALAEQGSRVLVVDMDPQAHATLALGIDAETLDENLYEILIEPAGSPRAERISKILRRHSDRLHVAPSGIVLSTLEQKLTGDRAEGRTERLASALASVENDYDYALIDCPPNVGVLTFNALRAAREVIVPLETSEFALHGVQKLLETIALLADRVGHALDVRILCTLYDGRTRYARETLSEIRALFPELCFDSVIRANVKLREAARRGQPIQAYAPRAAGAQDYAALALEVTLGRPGQHAQPHGAKHDEGASPREVTVSYRDAIARDVRIAGDFNGWVPDKDVRSHLHVAGRDRVWTKVLTLPPGRYRYRYLIDGEWREDPENPERTAAALGGRHSVLVVR
jgi:chromosome partitioning protein